MAISVSEKASKEILKTMNNVGLDSNTTFLYLKPDDDSLNLSFVKEELDYPDEYIDFENSCNFYGLKVIQISNDVLVDWAEINGKSGIVIR